jgi:esterase/lipase superfamily enzyme
MKSVRLEATKYIWTGFAVVMGLMFGGSFFGYEVGVGHVVLGIVISIATFLSTGTVWNWGSVKMESEFMQAEETSEKSKRHRSKSLSDGELVYQEKRR